MSVNRGRTAIYAREYPHQADIVEEGHSGFLGELNTLTSCEAETEVFNVPGSFEIPLFVRLGEDWSILGDCSLWVRRGRGIYRHEFVAGAVLNGLMQA